MALYKRMKNRLKPPPALSLREYYDRRNKILIIRETGGLGDILMHRMMFEDFKKIAPDIKIVFACLPQYHNILRDHPFIDEIVDSREVDSNKFISFHTTTCACTRYEIGKAPHSGLHRSDIWANHCGVRLTNHDMHLQIDEEFKKFGRDKVELLKKGRKGPVVLLCPVSAMIVKNLTPEQMQGTVKGLEKRGCIVIGSHQAPIPGLDTIAGTTINQLIGVIDSADYVVSVDTGQFHAAGGLRKPLTGIFTFADGKVYGKYYDFVLVQKHRDNGDWDCGPCYNWGNCTKLRNGIPKPCLTEISVEMILNGVDEMFKRWPWKY